LSCQKFNKGACFGLQCLPGSLDILTRLASQKYGHIGFGPESRPGSLEFSIVSPNPGLANCDEPDCALEALDGTDWFGVQEFMGYGPATADSYPGSQDNHLRKSSPRW
jgi:hypothetical protein